MRIAVLAWGSLWWNPGTLNKASDFAPNGPLVPIEFCRISADRRLTLVVNEDFGDMCTTYSALSGNQNLEAAIENLGLREESRPAEIGFVDLAAGKQSRAALKRHPQVVATIEAWVESAGYDAAIWTALASNFEEGAGELFSVTAALRYLEMLERKDATAFTNALDYIRSAPPEVQTTVRDGVARRWPG